MENSWDIRDGASWEPKQKEQKTIYSQSFTRGGSGPGRGGRGNFRDRTDRSNRRDDQDGYGQSDRGRVRSNYGRNNYDRSNQRSRYPYDDHDHRDNFDNFNFEQDSYCTKMIRVNTSCIGKIIGKGGSNVKSLQQDTGAKINVNRGNRSETTEISLSGTEEQVALAEQKINEMANDPTPSFSKPFERTDNNSRPYEHQDNSRSYDRNDRSDGYRQGRNNNYLQNRSEPAAKFPDRPIYSDSTQSNYCKQPEPETDADPNFIPIDWTKVYAESEEKSAAFLAKLGPIVKELYHEDPEVANMSASEVSEFRLNNMNISVSREFAEKEEDQLPIPNPIKTFEQAFRPYPEILKTISDQGFSTPSPIQSQAWPIILSGQDMIGIAQTGTGKTLAFLLPALIHIEAQLVPRAERSGPTVVCLSPTRELALQIEKEINKYSYRDIKCVCVYGGGDRKAQEKWLKEDRPEIIVATPGRLDDFVMIGIVKLDSVSYVVLDEADKMLEMGFECQIRKILINIRSDRQSIMTSATWPSDVRRLASQYTVNPVQVVIGTLDLTAVHSVTQDIVIIDEERKRELLLKFLRRMEPEEKVIVFCSRKSVTDDISSNLILDRVPCQSLHGGREQVDREQAIHDFKTGAVRILIATDVAARGLDIADITHVFNYDFPKNIEEYVHRIGRTGRAGRSGESVSLFTRKDWANAASLIEILIEANQGVPEELLGMAKRFAARQKRDGPGGGFRGRGGGRGRGGSRGRGGGSFNRY